MEPENSLVRPHEFRDLYLLLIGQAPGTGVSATPKLYIYVSNDVDSVCALQILTSLLRTDNIPHSVRPVSSYDSLIAEARQQTGEGKSLAASRSIVLINCGATRPIAKHLFEDLPESTAIYVVDSHRPFHLENVQLNARREIHILDDTEEVQAYPVSQSPSSADDPSSESEAEGSQRGADADLQRKRRRLNRTSTYNKEYYANTSYATPAACLTFDIAYQLGRWDRNMLWLAIVAATDAYVHQRINHEAYSKLHHSYDQLVKTLTPVTRLGESLTTLASEDQLQSEDDYRFMLYRHWNLYDSLYHTRFVASRLRLWTDQGVSRLSHFLTQIGLPQSACKESFQSMSFENRDRLREKLPQVGPKHGLNELFFPSFTRPVNSRLTISASDHAFALTGILESRETMKREGEEDEGADDDAGTGGDSKQWETNFWTAYSAVSFKPGTAPLIKKGIQAAITLQQQILQQGLLILQQRHVTLAQDFRYVILNEDNPVTSNLSHPIALSKLAAFLDDSIAEAGKPRLPLLAASYDKGKQAYLLVGHVGFSPAEGRVAPNIFGEAFRGVAQHSRIDVSSYFDGAVATVRRESLKSFIEQLHYYIQDMNAL